MINKLGQNKEWIWKRRGAYQILELAKQGKSVPEIAKMVNWREDTIRRFISSPTFLQKFDAYLKSVFFEFQKDRILALEEVSKLFLDVIMGRKTIDGISKDQASRHLAKLLSLKETELKVINPGEYNIIVPAPKTSELEEPKDLAKEFGFKELQLTEEEKAKLDS